MVQGVPELRPDMDGLRLRLVGEGETYLIDGGKKRLIPSRPVYDKVFRDNNHIHDFDVTTIITGEPLPETMLLFVCLGEHKVYLLDGTELRNNQTKRHVANPKVMERYQFVTDQRIEWWNVEVKRLKYPDGPALTKEGPALLKEGPTG